MFFLFIFCMSSVLGTVWKVLLISTVARTVRRASFGAFRPSCMCCVSVVRSDVVELLAMKRVMSHVWCIFGRDQPLNYLRGLQKRDTGL